MLENGKVKSKYVTKKERESIEQIKETNNYKTLKEAYFHYKDSRVSFPEQIKRLENKVVDLQRENEELKEKLNIIGGFDA